MTGAEPRAQRDLELHDQFRPAAPRRARRAAARARARRRDHRAGRSAYRPAPPRHREADRIQDLPPGAALFRPARLLLAAVHGAQLRPRHRETARPRSADPRPISARLLRRADPHLQPHAEPRQPRHGRRRDDAEPVAVRAARGLHELLRAGVGRAHARRLVPPRRRPSGRAAEAAHRHRRLARHPRAAPVRGRDQPGRRQPHLQAAQRRYRHGLQGRRARLGLFRPDDPRRRHPLGSAQVAALRRLRPDGFRQSRSAPRAIATTASWSGSRRSASRRGS